MATEEFALSSVPSATTAAVHIVDHPEHRVHRFTDLLGLIGTVLGIVVVLLVGVYAQGTTAGLTEDVQGFASFVKRILVAPVNVLEGIVTLVVPTLLVVDLAVRREPRRILEALGAGLLGFLTVLVATEATNRYGGVDLVNSLTIERDGLEAVTMPALLAAVSAMLTAAGRRRTRKVVAGSWNFLWIGTLVAAISGLITLPAALVTVLIGRAAGMVVRYGFGTASDRAYGSVLVDGVARAGFTPARLVRVDPSDDYAPRDVDPVSVAYGRTRRGRIYELTTVEGHQLLVVALDGDQQVAGFITKAWRSLRLRGLTTQADVSLRNTAESTALVSHAARTAGVRTARVLGMSQARDTIVLVYQRPSNVRALSELAPEEVTDEVLDFLWDQINKVHAAGISHRSLTSDSILIGHDSQVGLPAVWLSSWENGEVASSPLARRIDRVQIVALTATKVGAKRAVEAAVRALAEDDIEQVAPLLQMIALPRATRLEVKAHGKLLGRVRDEILEHVPDAPAERENISRFSLRSMLTIGAVIVALVLVMSSFNAEQVATAFREANPAMVLVAVAWMLMSFVGAALALIAFSPVRLPMVRVLLVQVAASFAAVALPAGVGPAALNLRVLTKRGVHAALAVATVALVQVSGVVVTVVALFALSLSTGSGGTLAALPSSAVLIGVGVAAVVVAVLLIVPKVRTWVAAKVKPMVRQTWPRLTQILGQPWRLGLGLFGNLLLTVSFVGAFNASLMAFGQHLAIIDVAVLFLLGNTAGALVPTPGGIGAVELTLFAGLSGAGVPVGVATSVVVLFRAVTYLGKLPLGYIALRYLQRKGEL